MTIPGYSVVTDMSTFLKSGTLADARTNLGIVTFTSVAAGIVPASGGGTTNYLRADGTWAAPAGGSATDLSYNAATRLLSSSTGADVTLPLATSADAGLAPASGGGTTNFLRADLTWAAPPGGSGTDLSYTASTRLLASSTGADVTLPLVTTGDAGLAPASGGGTTNFLRADATWAAPPVTDLSYTAATRLLASSTGADVTLPLFSATDPGLTPLSGGGTTNYLRADGTWAAPAGTTNLTYTAATRVLASDTGTDATLPLVTTGDAGLAPASGGGTTNYLRADGTWAAPPGGAGTTNLTYTAATRIIASDTGTDATLPLVTTGDAGLAPASGGGTTNYLRADATWAAPVGTTNLTYTAATRVLASDTGTDATLPLVTSTDAGLAPASGGGTANFLRADATWAAPPAGSSDTLIYNRLTGTYVLTSTVAAQKLFNWSTNGAVQVDTGLWIFQCIFTITGMSNTSGNLQFRLVGGGTATIDSITYHGIGIDNNTPTNAGAQGGSFSYTSNSAASIITAGTGTGVGVNVTGFFRCTASGTIIPSIALVTAAAGTVAAGSCFYARRVTSSTTIAQGTWT